MHLVKPFILCLVVGLLMGFITSFFAKELIGFSPYTITIPAAFAPFFLGQIKRKKEDS